MTENLNRISTNVDILISKHGSQKTADILESIALDRELPDINIHSNIIVSVCKIFKINAKLLETSDAEIYKKARKSCFYLLHNEGKLSHQQIRSKFPKMKHTRGYVGVYIKQMENIIKMPNIDKDHYNLHQQIKWQKEDQGK